jgi:dTDP-4-dehydrorhamnose 3,5-epimerase
VSATPPADPGMPYWANTTVEAFVMSTPSFAAGYVGVRGSLPFLDLRDEFWSEPVVYGYEIMIRPGRIKGWGMHEQQTDRYLIATGNVRIALYDGRPDQESHGRIAEFFFTEATPGLLAIPPGVWHADQNWGKTDAHIVNFPTHPYDHANPDKFRIDPHSDVIPFDWELRDG